MFENDSPITVSLENPDWELTVATGTVAKTRIGYLDIARLSSSSWVHAAIFRAMVESSVRNDIVERYNLSPESDLLVELKVNGVEANVIPFFESMGEEFDAQVEKKAIELIEEKFQRVWYKLEELKADIESCLKS